MFKCGSSDMNRILTLHCLHVVTRDAQAKSFECKEVNYQLRLLRRLGIFRLIERISIPQQTTKTVRGALRVVLGREIGIVRTIDKGCFEVLMLCACVQVGGAPSMLISYKTSPRSFLRRHPPPLVTQPVHYPPPPSSLYRSSSLDRLIPNLPLQMKSRQ